MLYIRPGGLTTTLRSLRMNPTGSTFSTGFRFHLDAANRILSRAREPKFCSRAQASVLLARPPRYTEIQQVKASARKRGF